MTTDTLIASLTVWRVASEDSNWNVGLRPYFMGTDSTGMPDVDQMISVGSKLIIPNGDGIHPIEFKWTFDPPITLPGAGRYAFYLFQDPCSAYFDILTRGLEGTAYPDGEAWATFRSWGCTPIPWMNSYPNGDLVFGMEFCDTSTVPVLPSTWGRLKTRYR